MPIEPDRYDYCTGLLMPAERKTVEPMAAVTAPARVAAQHQSLLHFMANAPWSDAAVLKRVREIVLPEMTGGFHDALEPQCRASHRHRCDPPRCPRGGSGSPH